MNVILLVVSIITYLVSRGIQATLVLGEPTLYTIFNFFLTIFRYASLLIDRMARPGRFEPTAPPV